MPRDISDALRTELEAPRTDEVMVFFATITHDTLIDAYRFNSDLVDYVYQGNTFLAAAFKMSLVTDDEGPPHAEVSIHNVDQAIGEAIQALATSPRIDIQLFAASDFTEPAPVGTPPRLTRTAIGTPDVVYPAPYLQLRNVSCNAQTLTGELVGADLSTDPWPAIRSTKDRLPGLYR